MALVLNNRVRETTATTGTGTVTLAGAVDGFQTFAAGIGNSNTTYYAISLNTSNEWEVELGTLSADSSTMARTNPPLESSNGDALVSFSAGTKEIFCTLPSEKALYLDSAGAILSNAPPLIISAWESKSGDFTAEAGKGYFCDTSSNTITVTLPSPTINDIIRFLDVEGTFDTYNLTVLYGSSKIQGASANLTVATERAGFALVYYSATQGWLLEDK